MGSVTSQSAPALQYHEPEPPGCSIPLIITISVHRWKAETNRFRSVPWRIQSIPTIVKLKDVCVLFILFWGYFIFGRIQYVLFTPGVERVPAAHLVVIFFVRERRLAD
jgi:hypothetical protein